MVMIHEGFGNGKKLGILPQFGGDMRRTYEKDGTVAESFEDVVILGGARTPFGKIMGDLKNVSAGDLLSIAVNRTMEKAKVDPKDVRQVIVGNIIANDAQNSFMPRAIGLRAGVAPGASTVVQVNRLCGTGFEVARQAAQQLSNGGENAVILTGGVENMSRTPVMDTKRMELEETVRALPGMVAKATSLFAKAQLQLGLLMKSRELRNHKLGSPYENPIQLGLTDPNAIKMLATADKLAGQWGISRKDIDDYAWESQNRYQKALKEGRFKDEIVPVKASEVKNGRLSKGKEQIDEDGHPRSGPREKLDKLPAMEGKKPGAIHSAANSSGLVDGAAAVALSSGAFAKEKNMPILAQMKSVAVSGCDPSIMGFGPAKAIPAALKAAGLTLDDMAYVEINEAFAGQVLACAKALAKGTTSTPRTQEEARLSVEEQNRYDALMSKLNVDGSSIAVGHPLSATGSRILLHAANRLRDDNKQYAVVSACIGGGQGIAVVLENPSYKGAGAAG